MKHKTSFKFQVASFTAVLFLLPMLVFAVNYSSTSFTVQNPVIDPGLKSSQSTNFGLGQSLSQTAVGESSSTHYQLWSGFQYFYEVSANTLTATAGDGQVSLSWTAPQGSVGVVVGSYEVGVGTVSGSYVFQDVGSVTSYTKTGLTNGTKYYFKIKAKTPAGALLVFSDEAASTPFQVATFINNSLTLPGNTSFTSTPSLTVTQQISLAVGGNSVVLPVNTVISKASNEIFDATAIQAVALPVSSVSGLGSNANVDVVFSWGIPNTTLAFSNPVTLSLAVDPSLNGTTLTVERSISGDAGWTSDGIVAPGTCVVASGLCIFATTKGSFFAAFHTSSSSNNNNNTGSTSGGGGGGSPTPSGTAIVILRGLAYPRTPVTVLKDGAIIATTPADPGATFSVILAHLTAGTYTFGVYATDSTGVRSATQNFVEILTNNVTVEVNSIFLSPSIGLSHTIIKQGDALNIFGFTAPKSDVNVIVNSARQFIEQVKAQDSGAWFKAFNTLALEVGPHNSKSQASNGNLLSPYSNIVSFHVGDESVAAPVGGQEVRSDFNGDGRINLVDFSILLFNWNKTSLANPRADINKDGIVNLVDFSILLYDWTG
jgi:hypothetical protein